MRKRWRGCLGGLSCFGKQKGGTRIVPASRVPDSNMHANQPNGAQVGGIGMTNPAAALLAPPSSPASFSNSAIPSTVQSPNCFLSANSPVGGPSSTMYATGPYAHETQLVSPPVFSTYTTQPSTAPLTPPPELAHLTTPSSPDVPYAQFLSSSKTGRRNYTTSSDSQLAHSPSPVSPATSSRRSPVSRASRDSLSASFPDRDFSPQWDPLLTSQEPAAYARSGSGRLYGFEGSSKKTHDSNFFCPATFAQFYLDPSSNPQSAGRLSVSKEADAYSYGGNGNLNRHNKPNKQDAEELEAYRASFGFSADEITTTSQYVEISDIADDSFTMTPFPLDEESKSERLWKDFPTLQEVKTGLNHMEEVHNLPSFDNALEGHHRSGRQYGQASKNRVLNDDDAIFSKMGGSRNGRKHQFGLSSSDAEVEYRRSRSLRHGKRDLTWRD